MVRTAHQQQRKMRPANQNQCHTHPKQAAAPWGEGGGGGTTGGKGLAIFGQSFLAAPLKKNASPGRRKRTIANGRGQILTQHRAVRERLCSPAGIEAAEKGREADHDGRAQTSVFRGAGGAPSAFIAPSGRPSKPNGRRRDAKADESANIGAPEHSSLEKVLAALTDNDNHDGEDTHLALKVRAGRKGAYRST